MSGTHHNDNDSSGHQQQYDGTAHPLPRLLLKRLGILQRCGAALDVLHTARHLVCMQAQDGPPSTTTTSASRIAAASPWAREVHPSATGFTSWHAITRSWHGAIQKASLPLLLCALSSQQVHGGLQEALTNRSAGAARRPRGLSAKIS